MKPLPSENSRIREQEAPMPSLPSILPPPSGSYSVANRRATATPVQKVYPWLLFTSTVIAAVFCLMYITKPVIMAASHPLPDEIATSVIAPKSKASSTPGLMPSASQLPGEQRLAPADPRQAIPGSTASSNFEDTNLRIQHVLAAEAPGGDVSRIVLDVPVLYQSRNLRWTPAEVAKARELLARLGDYQEKSRALRAEGVELLDSWNQLVNSSIPAEQLRADSPSLPANQHDAADDPRPAGFNTTESIQIQSDER